jgi:hypothetical protein
LGEELDRLRFAYAEVKRPLQSLAITAQSTLLAAEFDPA